MVGDGGVGVGGGGGVGGLREVFGVVDGRGLVMCMIPSTIRCEKGRLDLRGVVVSDMTR